MAAPATTTTRRLGRYELIAEIARGGMGAVLLARVAGAGGFQRLFAIKLLHRQYLSDEEFVEMLLDEARIAARLHHPNVVGITEVTESEEFGYGLVMDYVEGFTAWDMNQALGPPSTQRFRVANRVVIDALMGLDAAHNLVDDDGHPLNVVHRDVSPQNILIGVDGVARVTDFGIAKAAARMSSTRAGQVKGKVAYMAPEQARGKPLDGRTDVFACGICLWELLTGQRLFKRSNEAETFAALMTAPVPHLREVVYELPAELEAVCAKALQRDVDQRYPTAAAMAEALEKAARSSNLLADRKEVGDWIRTTFAAALEGRRKAIRAATGNDGPRMPTGRTASSASLQVPAANAALSSPPTMSISTSAVREIKSDDPADEWEDAPDTTVGASPLSDGAKQMLDSLEPRGQRAESAAAGQAAKGHTPPATQSAKPAAGRPVPKIPVSTMVGVDMPAGVAGLMNAAAQTPAAVGPDESANLMAPSSGLFSTPPNASGGFADGSGPMTPGAKGKVGGGTAIGVGGIGVKAGGGTAIGLGSMGPIPGTPGAVNGNMPSGPMPQVMGPNATMPPAMIAAAQAAAQQAAAQRAAQRAAQKKQTANRTIVALGVMVLVLGLVGSVVVVVVRQGNARAAAAAAAAASASALVASAQAAAASATATVIPPPTIVTAPPPMPTVVVIPTAVMIPVATAMPTMIPTAVPVIPSVEPTAQPSATAAPPVPTVAATAARPPAPRPTGARPPRPRPTSRPGGDEVPF